MKRCEEHHTSGLHTKRSLDILWFNLNHIMFKMASILLTPQAASAHVHASQGIRVNVKSGRSMFQLEKVSGSTIRIQCSGGTFPSMAQSTAKCYLYYFPDHQ